MADYLSKVEKSAQAMEHLIDHEAHGYSQIHRDGDGTVEVIAFSNGERAKILGGDGDCSEDIRRALAAAGIFEWDYWASYMWTGNEIDMLKSHGFKQVDLLKPKRGDVLWRHGHTGMYLGNNVVGEAMRSETGGIDGRQGDQDGLEVRRDPYYPYEWESAWRYVEPEPAPKPVKLVVDGMIGANTVRAWQRAEGVTETGVISNQVKSWQKAHFPSVASVTYGTSGSSLIRKIQKRMKLDVDGLIGPNTAAAIQKRLKKLGYDPGPIDGMIGANTAKALQRCLNEGKWS